MARFHSVFDQNPPPDLLDEIEAAWERADELAAQGCELHFTRRRDGVRADLRRAGVPLRRLTPSQALEIACGGAPVAVEQ